METETGVDGTTHRNLSALGINEEANIDDIFTSEYYESISNELLNQILSIKMFLMLNMVFIA